MTGHTRGVSVVRFSPDGRWLASGSADRTVKLWNVSGGRFEASFEGHTLGINDLAWSGDSKVSSHVWKPSRCRSQPRCAAQFIATASDDETVCVWEVATQRLVRTLSGHTHYVFCVNYNPQSNLIASGSVRNDVRQRCKSAMLVSNRASRLV